MTTTRTTPAVPAPEVVRVRVPGRGLRQDLRAVKVVWQRELIRFGHDRIRIVSALVQPILFLFVLGGGLQSLTAGATRGTSLSTVIFPGVLATTVMFTAVFSAVTIVWDREFGFLREMLVAPVSRGALVLGKSLGGATVASIQGVLVLCLAGLVHVPYSPALLLTLLGELLLLGFTLTAFGMAIAARIRKVQSVMGVMQMLLMPLMFLSGALFPLTNLPGWLHVLTHLNPLTYAVDPMRHAVFAHLQVSEATRQAVAAGMTWWGWHVPTLVELGIVAVAGLLMLVVATVRFQRAE
jgi:ABC-2 type transport system permease protein